MKPLVEYPPFQGKGLHLPTSEQTPALPFDLTGKWGLSKQK